MPSTADAARQKMVANLKTNHFRQDEQENSQKEARLVTPFDVAANPLKYGADYMLARKQPHHIRQDAAPAKSQAEARQRMIDRLKAPHAPISSQGPQAASESTARAYRSDAWRV